MTEGRSPPQGELPGLSIENCTVHPLLHSPGVWDPKGADGFLNYALPRLLLQLAAIFIITQSLHLLLRRLHLSRIVSEILAGIVLGPTLLGQIPNFTDTFFPVDGEIFIDILSKVGYIFFIFLSGVKMDPRMVMTTGAGTVTAWTIGVLAPLVPFAGGMTLNRIYENSNLHRYHWPAVKNIISTHNLFAFPVIASVLVDLKILNSELGRLALTSTLISDLVSNAMSTIASNIRIGYAGWMNGIGILSAIVTLAVVFILLGIMMPIAKWIIKQTPEGKPVHGIYIIFVSVAVLVSAILADNTGMVYQYGPFILGLALPDGPPLGSALVQKLETLICGLFGPLLVTYCGTKVNLIELINLAFIGIVWVVTCACLAMKFCAILFPALMCKVPVKDAFALAFIMSTQGVVQMAFYFNFSIGQTFDPETFSMVISSVLVIAVVTQLGAKSLYDYSRIYTGYQKRDIQHISHSAELRVLACAHRMDDVLAVKKLLGASLPNRESPLAVYALNLVELTGRAYPLLINHQLGQKTSVGGFNSTKMVEIFNSFGQQHSGLLSMQIFTAISMPRFMHHDICSLAFDKLASLIILPFHRKWNQQGKMILDSSSLRVMNCHVFDMAPCSVGILVDRHRIKRPSPVPSTYNVAVVFIGGADDREALAYGKRMARSPGIYLTVIRFVPFQPISENQWDAVLDAEILKETRLHGIHGDNVMYKEEKVRDGAETALQLHTLGDTFDLILVGRRHREESPQLLGLSEWNDLPELGPVGDMLASSEISKPVSILVVQKQIVRNK